jgi:hypothetical protein
MPLHNRKPKKIQAHSALGDQIGLGPSEWVSQFPAGVNDSPRQAVDRPQWQVRRLMVGGC